MRSRSLLTWFDLVLYSWWAVFLLAFAVGWPALALGYLCFPPWHRCRMRARARVMQAARARAFDCWVLPHFEPCSARRAA